MTELLFRDDAYLKSCRATVVALHGAAVELDRTVFYPMGGGQPGDSGRIGALRVADARRSEDGERVLHVLEPGAASPAPGTPV
jgi:misacylated tRNA(Ala) deacylase